MPEVSEDLAGEFVLGALEADELVAVERRMRDEPDFRRAVDAWSRRLAPLLEQVSPKTPPVSAWSAIQRRVGGGPSVARRRSEGVWLDIAPGVQLKMLRVDRPPASVPLCSAWNLVLPAPSMITPRSRNVSCLRGR